MAFFVNLKNFGVIHGSVEPAFSIMHRVFRFRDYLKFSRQPDVPRGKERIHFSLFINKINHCRLAVLLPIISVNSLRASS